MLGLWLEDGELRVRDDLSIPVPASGEALIRVRRAGICNTDIELTKGYYPFTGILGHEFAGIVEQGPVNLVGERVVGEINATCGDCEACRQGRPNHCSRRTVLGIVGRNGAFAEYLCLPVDNLYSVPEPVSLDAATFTEPLAAAVQILEQVSVESSDRVLIVGDGKLGQLVGVTLALVSDEVTVLGRHESKLAILRDCGLETAFGEPGRGVYDVVVECTGNPAGFDLARAAVRPAGTIVLKSTYAGELTLDASALVVDEIRLVGSRCGPFQLALDLLSEGTIDVDRLVSDRFGLRDAPAAFARSGEPGVLKVLMEMPG